MSNNDSIFIFCGEQSADIHGAALTKELFLLNSKLKIFGVGGSILQKSGVELIRRNDDLAIVGFVEVLKHYKMFKELMDFVVSFIKSKDIKTVILIDYPGFNLRLAKLLKPIGVKVIYYISPQLWAWGKKRIEIIKKYINHMIVIFDFEKEFYKSHGIESSFVGHPLIDHDISKIDSSDLKEKIGKVNDDAKRFAFLPGSRKNEVSRLIPVFISTMKILNKKYPGSKFIISASSNDRLVQIEEYISKFSFDFHPIIYLGDINKVIKEADLTIVASGTASLQTALHEKPMIVVYKISPWTYWLIKRMILIRHVSIVNIILNKKAVPELIQNRCNSKLLFERIERFFKDKRYRESIIGFLKLLKQKLGEKGVSVRAANIILRLKNEKTN